MVGFARPRSGSREMSASKNTGEALVSIATAPNEPIARMWAEILKDEGIHCLITGTDLMSALYVPAVSQYEIRVLASQAEKARAILASLREE